MEEIAVKRSTRERIIEAAGLLMAEKGFDSTTVKDITECAGANVAAVNYYFRDKEKLYEEVILSIFRHMREKFPVDKGLDATTSPESRFRTLVRNLFYRFLSPEKPVWQGILLAHERMNPKPITLMVIHEEISKTRSLLLACISNLLGPGAKPEEIELCHESVIGQILHQANIRTPHAPPLVRKEAATAEEIDRMARHVAEFCLAGMRQVRATIEEQGGKTQ